MRKPRFPYLYEHWVLLISFSFSCSVGMKQSALILALICIFEFLKLIFVSYSIISDSEL
jgi:hypothetical protein